MVATVSKELGTLGLGTPSPESVSEREKIIKDGLPLEDALQQILSNPAIRYTLLGENHASGGEVLRHSLAASLEAAKAAGITHLGLERHHDKQPLLDEYQDSTNPTDELQTQVARLFTSQPGAMEIIREAKRLGIRLIALDSSNPHDDPYDAAGQNARDSKMADILARASQERADARFLIWIGSAHVHKRSVSKAQSGPIVRLGARLPVEQTASIRFVIPGSRVDDLLQFISPGDGSTLTAPDLPPGEGSVYVLPDSGEYKGDSRVSAADYVAIIA